MTLQTDVGVLLVIGTLFLLIGLLGGGFEIAAIKIPVNVGKYPRIFSAGLGVFFLIVGMVRLMPSSAPGTANSGQVASPTSLSPAPTLIAATTAQPAIPPTPATRRILVDRYHGGAWPILDGADGAALQAKGFSFETASSELTADNLSNYDVLIIWFASYNDETAQFAESEIAAIREFADEGGGVFLVGLGWVWVEYGKESIESYPLNKITDGSGIFFTEYFINTSDGISNKEAPLTFRQPYIAEDHPVTMGITQISGGKAAPGALLVKQPAFPLVWGNENTFDSNETPKPIIMAASVLGEGRIVALQHIDYVMPFVSTYENADYPNIYDNVQLLENVLGWLSEK
jgi:hypothetical protein